MTHHFAQQDGFGEYRRVNTHDDALFELPGRPARAVPFAAPATLRDVVSPDWAAALSAAGPRLHEIADFLGAEQAAGKAFLPAPENILRAFQQPLNEVKVIIVGQDPYPTPGHSIGLAFAAQPNVRPLPRSLLNIYRELSTDLGIRPPNHGDLSSWARHGVLLLNRVLTVHAGNSGSHRRRGWEAVTELAIRALVENRRRTGQPLVAILWGRDAQALAPLLGDVPRIESAHPSPLSAARGFFGSRPFSRANRLLEEQGGEPVDWRLDS